ncbi:hypothetical protein MMC27_007750 [Xylographa pallens]|nr:hypothetical protein [Xylographa pallens]
MKLSVTLASLVYFTPSIIQAFPYSYEDGTLDVRDAPEALYHQLTQHHGAKPIEGAPDENRPQLIYGKERRDAELNYETPHDVSNAHGEELMIERDASPILNSEANTYPHYRHHGKHSKLQHTQKHGKSQKTHQSKHQSSQPDEQSHGDNSYNSGDNDLHEQSQGATHSGDGEKDTAKAKDSDGSDRPQNVAENNGRAAAKPGHEERDVKGTGHREHAGKAAHTTRPHKAKATHFVHGEKDQKKPHNPEFHANLNKVAAVQGKVAVKPNRPVVRPTGAAVKHHHEVREAQEANPHPAHPKHSTHEHTTVDKAHRPKATFFIHGEKDAAKPQNPQFHSKLHEVAAKQGRIPVKPAGPVVKPTGPTLKHHRPARDVEPATTHSHSHHHMGTSIPLASKSAIQEKVAKVLEHEFPQYSGKIEQHLKAIQAHEGHIMTKREAEPLAKATVSTTHHHHTRSHLPAASRVILEEKVAAVLEHNYPQYSGKIEQHLKQLQAHHQQAQAKQQNTGHTNSKRESEAEDMGVLEDEQIYARKVVERHPEATPPPAVEDQQHSSGKSHDRRQAGHPISHAALPAASRSILNEEIASILEEEYPQYSAKIAAHMKAYKAKHTGTPKAYQAGILGVQQPDMKAPKVAKPDPTGLPKREVDTLMDDNDVLAHNAETSQTTHSHLRGTGVLFKDYPNPTGHGHYNEYEYPANKDDEYPANKEAEPQANNLASKLSKWEQYLLNATLHHQLFAAPAEAAAPNPSNAGRVEARQVASTMDPTTTSHDFGYFGTHVPQVSHIPHVPVAEEAMLKQVLPLQKLAHEVLQGTATVSGGYHMASASGVIISALEKELPVGPNGQNENMLDLDVSMPAAAIHEPNYMMPPSRPPGMNYHSDPEGMSPYADSMGEIPNPPQPGGRTGRSGAPGGRTGRSGAPGWLSELVAEDRAAVSSVDPTIPLPTGSLQQQLAAFNELEATVSSDSPLATNTHLAEQLSANNGLMYDGPIQARPAKPGQRIPSGGDTMPDVNPASGGALPQTGQSQPQAGNAADGAAPPAPGAVNGAALPASGAANGAAPPAPGAANDADLPAPGAANGAAPPAPGAANSGAPPAPGAANSGAPPAPGAKKKENNVAVNAAANPYANVAGGDMSQDPAAAAKLDRKNVPMEHMRRNLWEILGVSDDV